MKKKLVAVAVAGVLGAPLAAHAQTANVTLYGRLNVDFEIVNGATCDGAPNPSGNTPCGNPQVTKNPTVTRLSSNSSRFGMRGSEALGGGLTSKRQGPYARPTPYSREVGRGCGDVPAPPR